MVALAHPERLTYRALYKSCERFARREGGWLEQRNGETLHELLAKAAMLSVLLTVGLSPTPRPSEVQRTANNPRVHALSDMSDICVPIMH
jgi:hypothetical protein